MAKKHDDEEFEIEQNINSPKNIQENFIDEQF